MSFISSLFGSDSSSSTPAPVQSTPTISSGSLVATDREQTARQRARAGTDKSILTSGLGDTSSGSTVNRTTALGGNTSLTGGSA